MIVWGFLRRIGRNKRRKEMFKFILLILLISSCTIEHSQNKLKEYNWSTITIDSCEYIVKEKSYGAYLGYGFLAHKGNCKYCKNK